jgi:hypothetical protein
MHSSHTVTIEQPCHESWAAMTPTTAGRHCAACQKNVVDFTLKTDAEILAYLAGAANGRTCGRFAAGQLNRPLQRAALAAPMRWRAWLAAAVAVWSLRETTGDTAHAQALAEWRARYWGGPAPATPPADSTAANTPQQIKALAGPDGKVSQASRETSQPPLVVRGTVLDSGGKEGLPGVTVLLEGTTVGTSTRSDGSFELAVPAEMVVPAGLRIVVSSVGYVSHQRFLPLKIAMTPQVFALEFSVMGGFYYRPWPWRPRQFFYWSKYWLTRPFRRD